MLIVEIGCDMRSAGSQVVRGLTQRTGEAEKGDGIVEALLHVLRIATSTSRKGALLFIELIGAKLGRNEDLVAILLKRFADERFIVTAAIYVGALASSARARLLKRRSVRIPESAADINGVLEDVSALFVVALAI